MPNTLTKADIVETIWMENGYSRKQSVEVTEILLEIIKQSLESGEDVMISRLCHVTLSYRYRYSKHVMETVAFYLID